MALRAIASASRSAVEQRAGRGERVIAARADAHDRVVGLEHVARAGQHQALVGVGHDHHGFEPAQIAVGAPVLGELDAGALELIGEALELGLQPLEQGEGVGGRPRRSRAITLPLPTRRTFLALPLMMVWPRVTWPSPAITTLPPLRTVRMVVPCQVSGGLDALLPRDIGSEALSSSYAR